MKDIVINVNNIDIKVTKKSIKNIHLSVYTPNGQVRLSVPKKMDEEAIKNFIMSKLSWIKKQRSRFKSQERQIPKEFISGESHYLFGDRYLLNLVETKGKQYVELLNNKDINLYVRPNSTKDKREMIMREWYREKLKSIIPGYIEKWEPIMDVKVEDWGVKLMKTIWGSCNIQDKRIWINLDLAKKNPRCLEYIIVHEMAHLIEPSHNHRFRVYMDRFLPNWKSIRAELNGLIYENDK